MRDCTHLEVEIPDFVGSYALLSPQNHVSNAVIFVHGFLGDPCKTWMNFQGLIEDFYWWRDTDLYFFAYNSFGHSIPTSADRLLKFIDWVLQKAHILTKILPEDLPPWEDDQKNSAQLRQDKPKYTDLTLVGHSEGGLVLRMAILEKVKEYQSEFNNNSTSRKSTIRKKSTDKNQATKMLWKIIGEGHAQKSPEVPEILNAKLRLFAPAILGARPAGWKVLALKSCGPGTLARLLLGMSPSYGEMSQNSHLLGMVRDGTEYFAKIFPSLPALKASILWAEKDSVVIDAGYVTDPSSFRAPGTTHVTVCKPKKDYFSPLRFTSYGRC